jgi:hypothetical protein
MERIKNWVIEIHDLRNEKEIVNYLRLHGYKVRN